MNFMFGMLVFWFVGLQSAHALSGGTLVEGEAWLAWKAEAGITVPILIASAIYVAGMLRRNRRVTDAIPNWRHVSFFVGLVTTFLALQSPIEVVGERLFFVHQIQHLLLRLLGPMLIALAWPTGTLIAGTPRVLRRNLLKPILSYRLVRRVYGAISHPVSATTLFIAVLYFWQIPSFHNRAVADDNVHFLMDASMFAAGLLFWLRIFERRGEPLGVRHGARVMMLVLVILSNIVLGSYTALKSQVLYSAYDVLSRPFGFAPLADEQIGGIIIWIPSSLMCLIGVLIVIQMYGRHEARSEFKRTRWSPSNSAILLYPTTGRELVRMAHTKNRSLAGGIAAFTVSVFAMSVFIGILSQLSWLPK